MNKFVHYYTRFKNHELSFKIEEPLLASVKIKFETLIAQNQASSPPLLTKNLNSSSILLTNNFLLNNKIECSSKNELNKSNSNFNIQENHKIYRSQSGDSTIQSENVAIENKSINYNSNRESDAHVFIEDAIKELLKSRRILRCSYVYGYFLDTFGHKKFIFEFIQTEFEEFTENLSQIIARPHLKTPKNKIIRLTNLLKRKRIEFLETIIRGLNSFSDTPPTLKKYSRQRWKYLLKDNIQNDDEFKNNIALSLKELNPKNPWIIDKKGRHTNLLALLNDWPELENELDRILVISKDKNELCSNKNCNKLKAINTLSGFLFNYCSIKCMRDDHITYIFNRKNSHNISNQGIKIDSLKGIKSNNKNESIALENINLKTSSNFDCKNYDKTQEKNGTIIIENILNRILNTKCSKEKGKSKTSNKKDLTSNFYSVLPYEPIFLDSKQNDISIIIKNMNNIVSKEKDNDKKINKVFNFEVKIKNKVFEKSNQI